MVGRALALVILLCLVAEILLREVWRVGNPPLTMPDPEIEYLFRPGRYEGFGNEMFYNEYSMRSAPVTPHKTDPNEFRVLVMGDSAINGGMYVDQTQTVTERLRIRLLSRVQRPVFVGNVSAASWGPPNLLAYARRFGLFDADVVIGVLSSDDDRDIRLFEPIPAYVPTSKPRSALAFAISRGFVNLSLLYRRLRRPQGKPVRGDKPPGAALPDLGSLAAFARSQGACFLVVKLLLRREINRGADEGHQRILDYAESISVPAISMGEILAERLASGQDPYSADDTHLSEIGRSDLVDALFQGIVEHCP